MKTLVIGSKEDIAARGILMNIIEFGGIDYLAVNTDVMDASKLDTAKMKKYDLIIFASKHQSKEERKTLSIHAPGNFREVWGGGEAGRLSLSSALFQKHLFEKLNEKKEQYELNKYEVTLECTHHGPLLDVPSVFIEVGGSINEWRDKRACFCIATAIKEAVETFKINKYREVAVGIGGNHYCQGFNKIQLKSNVALSHIIPKYVSPIKEEFILEAINQTIEEVDFVVLDWKGLGRAEERDKIIKILDDNYISWKKVSQIPK